MHLLNLWQLEDNILDSKGMKAMKGEDIELKICGRVISTVLLGVSCND